MAALQLSIKIIYSYNILVLIWKWKMVNNFAFGQIGFLHLRRLQFNYSSEIHGMKKKVERNWRIDDVDFNFTFFYYFFSSAFRFFGLLRCSNWIFLRFCLCFSLIFSFTRCEFSFDFVFRYNFSRSLFICKMHYLHIFFRLRSFVHTFIFARFFLILFFHIFRLFFPFRTDFGSIISGWFFCW